MADLLDLVRERPINEKPSAVIRCIVCDSTGLTRTFRSETLIGGGDGSRDADPNHVWERYRCNDCGADFLRETKSGNTWYTAPDEREFGGRKGFRIIRGMPSCFESYQYTCVDCGGAVTRRYTMLDGVHETNCLGHRDRGDEVWVKNYRTFYTCAGCGRIIEVEQDYYRSAR